MDSDESHFNVVVGDGGGGRFYTALFSALEQTHCALSLTVRDKVTTRQCPHTPTFEAKGQPKRIRTEVPPLTSLTPYR